MPSNHEFLTALFGDDAPWVHVTDFAYDPSNIPSDKHLKAWAGNYFSRYRFGDITNQYFTISCFYADEKDRARRQKRLYRHTPVIVLDDVKEKLDLEQVNRLPEPTWVLETSPGSEQWGYLLNQPCTERAKVENLLDGLVANGLAPEGRDPGMKGVTRYVRLPDGYNNKANKLVNGQPFKCQMIVWNPFHTVTLEQLATPFQVDLDAPRREQRVDGASQIDDHPLLDVGDAIHVKEVRSAGRFDITCPWVDEHTGSDDSGAAVFTNSDGTIGFKCHHGACQERTGRHLLEYVEDMHPGFGARLNQWQTLRAFSDLSTPSFLDPAPTLPAPPAGAPAAPTSAPVAQAEPSTSDILNRVIGELRAEPPFSERARDIAGRILKQVDDLPEIEKINWHDQVRDIMRWSKPDFKRILQDLRQQWYSEARKDISFFDEVIYVGELNQFFDRRKRIFYTAEAYQNVYAHLDSNARTEALQGGMVTKVDKLDYAPLQPPVFEERGTLYGNSWSSAHQPTGCPGDATPWLAHWDALGWGEHREHMLQWMAWTILHPDIKINHMLLLGSVEGCGKDYLMYPLVHAMGEHHMTVDGEELLSDFRDYVLSTKHLHINEAELGDRKEAQVISNKLKPLAAAPPDKLRVNQKNIKPVQVRNVLSVSMTTNSQLPIRLNGPSRRIFALWSDMNPRDDRDQMTPEWQTYWQEHWEWMKNGGAEIAIWFLRNHVDLSKFNPGAPPPVTDFLREIREASKSPFEQTVDTFLRKRYGAFHADLATSVDLSETLRCAPLIAPQDAYCDVRYLTPIKVANILKGVPGVTTRVARNGREEVKVFVLRNGEDYRYMTAQELWDAWAKQLQEAKSAKPLTVVN